MEEPAESPLQCSVGCSSNSNSPEFEFWMIRNPSFPQPNLLSADQLFSDGFLLPLHKLNLSNDTQPALPPPRQGSEASGPESESSPVESAELISASPRLTSSKRWLDIFKKSSNSDGSGGKEKRTEKSSSNGVNGFGASELNINIWPFSRSRSAGNDGARPRPAVAVGRKVSSAPCSRSNSAGDSKSRKWPGSPGRAAGVHLGRSSPVWKVRRGGAGGAVAGNARSAGLRRDGNGGHRKTAGDGGKARVLSFNVPVCIGYGHHLSYRRDGKGAHGVAAATCGGGGVDVSAEGVRGNTLFNIRSLFTKIVH